MFLIAFLSRMVKCCDAFYFTMSLVRNVLFLHSCLVQPVWCAAALTAGEFSYSEICWLFHLQYSYLCANFRDFRHVSWTIVCSCGAARVLNASICYFSRSSLFFQLRFTLIAFFFYFATLIHSHTGWQC